MIINNNLIINLIYSNDIGGRWRLDELLRDEGFISDEHLNLEEFFDVFGGIELIKDKHCIFYQSFYHYDLLSLVTFLLYSLASLNALDEKLFEALNIYKNTNVVSKITDGKGDLLLLENDKSDLFLKLSYIKDSKNIIHKNDFYFQDLFIDKTLWINTTKVTLNEYFNLLDKISKIEPELSNNSFLNELKNKWLGSVIN